MKLHLYGALWRVDEELLLWLPRRPHISFNYLVNDMIFGEKKLIDTHVLICLQLFLNFSSIQKTSARYNCIFT